jgi:hypothetical protein
MTNPQGNSTAAGRAFSAQHHFSFVSDPTLGALLSGSWVGVVLYKDFLVYGKRDGCLGILIVDVREGQRFGRWDRGEMCGQA